MEYRGHIIEKSLSYFGGYDYFLKDNGRDDCTKHASTFREAKDSIDDIIASEEPLEPPYKVRINSEIYRFPAITEALSFAEFWKGKPLFQIKSM